MSDGYQVRHIAPKSASSVKSAKALCKLFDENNAGNLIALPMDSEVRSKADGGFGKTTRQGYHLGYSGAATSAMAVAVRFKKSGLRGG
ncbi:hypothetical protein [Burkholderia sp. BCC1999]|uniref:hypothetical protein n=1 Tax=Burkholderia sp. BCC1999 TaxID=2817448 RepID=UPI002AC336D1|nr:hypothetical protein [Burkholderia sp. BCC1999]